MCTDGERGAQRIMGNPFLARCPSSACVLAYSQPIYTDVLIIDYYNQPTTLQQNSSHLIIIMVTKITPILTESFSSLTPVLLCQHIQIAWAF